MRIGISFPIAAGDLLPREVEYGCVFVIPRHRSSEHYILGTITSDQIGVDMPKFR